MGRVRALTGRTERRLDRWEMAVTPPGACSGPADAARLSDWIAATAPGTAAQALAAAGRWRADAPEPLHDKDVWWRAELPGGGARTLVCEGLATLAEAWLGERFLFASRSMFLPQEAALAATDATTLWICFRALSGALAAKGPRARWRPRMIESQGLRLVRTTLLGHMPGWCPKVDIVGPWREIRLV
jgi:beta-mannosidase